MARQQHLGRGKGMALQHSSISDSYIWLFVAASALLCCLPTSSAATVHTVGGDSGWSIMTPYSAWLQGKTFTVGDSLLFNYEQGWHDVTEVSKDGYDSCTGTGAAVVNKWTDGTTTVALDKPGVRYFICSFIGHCPPMKLAVTVAADASSHTNSSTTLGAPSPAPTTTSSVQAPPPATTLWSPPPSTPSVPPTTSAAPPPSWSTTTTPPPSSPPHFHDEPSSWSPMPERNHDDADTPDHSWSPTWAPSTPSWKPETPTWSPQAPSSWSPHPPTSSWISPSSSNWGSPSIAPSEEPSSWISPSSTPTWAPQPPIEEPSSWLTPSYVAPPPQAVAEEPTSTSAPPASMTTQPPTWTPTKAPTTAPSKAPSSSTRTPTAAPTKAPTTSRPPSGEPPAETPSVDVNEGVPPPASGPAVAESSFAHHHSPQFGALFLTVILALFFVNKF